MGLCKKIATEIGNSKWLTMKQEYRNYWFFLYEKFALSNDNKYIKTVTVKSRKTPRKTQLTLF